MKRRARTITASISPLRRLMLLAVVFAVSLQAYFVQTHLHGQLSTPTAPAYSDSFKAPVAPLPTDPMSPALCKLCQEVVHAGAAITPAGSGFALLLDWVAVAIPAASLPSAAPAPKSGGQSRAPPRA
jgi:hypothetical protein